MMIHLLHSNWHYDHSWHWSTTDQTQSIEVKGDSTFQRTLQCGMHSLQTWLFSVEAYLLFISPQHFYQSSRRMMLLQWICVYLYHSSLRNTIDQYQGSEEKEGWTAQRIPLRWMHYYPVSQFAVEVDLEIIFHYLSYQSMRMKVLLHFDYIHWSNHRNTTDQY